MEKNSSEPKKIGDFKYVIPSKNRKTERGELLLYFLSKINPRMVADGYKAFTIQRLATKLRGRKLSYLYYLRSLCDDTERRGGNWSLEFFATLKKK